ncbi:MAG: hypothetical protein AAFW75_28430 [Cyanobacteria bacterium J06636_16]
MTDQVPDITGLAELKAAIGNLWKKVDAFENNTRSDSEQVGQQISEWTQTNLVLLRLLADLSEETQSLGKNSNELAQTSISLASAINSLPSSLEEVKLLLLQLHKTQGHTQSSSSQINRGIDLQKLQKKLSKLEQLLSDVKKSERGSSDIQISHNEAQPAKSKAFSLGIITIAYMLFSVLNIWIGWQVRIWQISSDPDYRTGQELVKWNQKQLQEARRNNQSKSTLWIVPPELREQSKSPDPE